jgi:hypothetical protein
MYHMGMMLLVDSHICMQKLAQRKMHINLIRIIKNLTPSVTYEDNNYTSIDALEIRMTCTTRQMTPR